MKDRHKPRPGDRHKTKSDRHKTKADRHKNKVDRQKLRTEKNREKALDREYCTVDGEAYQNGRYFVLAAYNGREHREVINHDGLTTAEIFAFLLDQGKELWGFAIGYDVNHWLCSLGETHLQRLRTTHKCYWGRYKIEHIPNKCFRLWEREERVHIEEDGTVSVKRVSVRSCTVWDIFSFVGTSFAKWVRDWQLDDNYSEELYEWLCDMKDARHAFSEEHLDDILRYNRLELTWLHRGVGRLKRLAASCGFYPSSWYSPASLAACALKEHGVVEHKACQPDEPDSRDPQLLEAIAGAYYGGRFEISTVGFLPGPIYAYDIRSAYPSAIVGLPSLAGGQWRHVRSKAALQKLAWHDPSKIMLLRVEWEPHSLDQTWGPFPMRHKNFIRFPLSSASPKDYRKALGLRLGWYWSCEVIAALPYAKVEVREAWVFTPASDAKPFAWVADLYERRREMKAQNDPAQYVLKLIINSLYGKLAQRPFGDRIPRYYDLMWAGLITAQTRAKLLRAAAQYPIVDNPVFMFTTDGLYSTKPLTLDVGPGLGQWEQEILSWIVVVQNGVYYYKGSHGLAERRRGLRKPRLSNIQHRAQGTLHRRIYRHWKYGEPIEPFSRPRFVGYRQALAWGKLEKWRTWQDDSRAIEMTAAPKRIMLDRVGLAQKSRPRYTIDEGGILSQDLWALVMQEMAADEIFTDGGIGGGHDSQLEDDQPDAVE